MDERPIRNAASILVGRDGDDGLELLVVERGRSSRFLPGYVAFPGGSVEQGDEGLAKDWFGDEREVRRATVVRELIEEVSLTLTAKGLAPAVGPDPLGPVHDAPPGIEQLPAVAHWIPPARIPVRFDTWYYAATAPGGVEPIADGTETAAAWWESPRSLLVGSDTGARKLYWPTYFTVLQLDRLATVDDLLDLRFETREPAEADVAGLPRWVFEQD